MNSDFEMLLEHIIKIENYVEKLFDNSATDTKLWCTYEFNNRCFGSIVIFNDDALIIKYDFNLMHDDIYSLSDNVTQLINVYVYNIITFNTLIELRTFVHNNIDSNLTYDELNNIYNVSFDNEKPVHWFLSTNVNCGVFGCEYVDNNYNSTYTIYGCSIDTKVSFDEMIQILNTK